MHALNESFVSRLVDEDEQTTSHKWTKETLSQVVAREVENDMIASGCVDKYLFPVESTSSTAEWISGLLNGFKRLMNLFKQVLIDLSDC